MKDLPKVEDFKSEMEFLDAFDLFIDFKIKVEKSMDPFTIDTDGRKVESADFKEFKLVALKYALKNSPIYSTLTIDRRTNYNTLRGKVKLFFTASQEPCADFFKLSIFDYSSIDVYLLECRRRAQNLMGDACPNECIERIVMHQTSEQFVPSFQCILKPRATTWAQFVDCLKSTDIRSVLRAVAVQSVRTAIVCFNCESPGHVMRMCRKKKVKCDLCNKWGHLRKYCRQKVMYASQEKTIASDDMRED